MNISQTRAAERLADVIKSMDDYSKGRLVGIGEGMALANLKANIRDKDAQRSALGIAPKESA